MQCSEIKELISSYIDDQLGPDEKEAFSFHIRSCPGCREVLEEVQAVHELFASAGRFSAPYGFTTRVMASLETKEPVRWRALFTLQPIILPAMKVAFALIVAITGMVLGHLLAVDKATPPRTLSIQEAFSLDLFQAAPPDSLGGVYVALAEDSHER